MAARAEALPAPQARRSVAPGLAVGFSTLYLSVIVLLPLAALAWAAHGWDAIRDRQAIAALKLTLVVSAVRRAHQRRRRDRDRVDARPRPLPRAELRQRARRPAVRAADDRRRPDAARALRAELARRRQRRVHALGCPRRAAVRDAAVRRPHGAAGAARARPRDGGGGGLARRGPVRDFGASSCRTSSRRFCPASRSRSRARSASSARSS